MPRAEDAIAEHQYLLKQDPYRVDSYQALYRLYSDQHGIFRRNSKEPETIQEQLLGRREPTQFGRLMEELLIEVVFAHSPEAKGRVERLWGTFQDRLVSELRRAGAKSLGEANVVLWAFLPRFNAHFARPPAQTESGRILFDVPNGSYRLRATDDNPDPSQEKAAFIEIPFRMEPELVEEVSGAV